MNTHKGLAIAALTSLFLVVALGAFGAHALQASLTPERLKTWNTAVTYQAWHSLGVLILAYSPRMAVSTGFIRAGFTLLSGAFLFSASLYLLCLTNVKWLAFITPVGGLVMLAGWALAVVAEWKYRS